jgi:hypothetical protein
VATYAIRYASRAAEQKATLSASQKASLEGLEKRLCGNPFSHGAVSNRNNSWTASFACGFITYIVSNRHVVINVIDVVAS